MPVSFSRVVSGKLQAAKRDDKNSHLLILLLS